MSTQNSHPTSPTAEITYVRYNPAYIRTVPGLIKVICLVLNLIGFICIQVSAFSYHSRGSFFSTISMTGFWFTGILLLLYVFQVVYKFQRIPWLRIEMFFCAGICLLYMLCSSLAAAMGLEAFTAAAFFGFCAMVVYGYDAFLKFKALRGDVILTQTQTTTTTVTVA